MTTVVLYISTLLTFLAVDIVWLKLVIGPLFERHVGKLLLEEPRLEVAFGFYALYVVGILYFASLPGLTRAGYAGVALDGFLLGLLAYGTYEATNMATLKGWHFTMLISDTLWGGCLTMLSAVVGVWIVRVTGLSTS